MNIKIDDNYCITSDPNNYFLNKTKVAKKGKFVGKTVLERIGSYGTLEQVFRGYKRIAPRYSEATNIKELQEDLKKIDKNIERLIRELNV